MAMAPRPTLSPVRPGERRLAIEMGWRWPRRRTQPRSARLPVSAGRAGQDGRFDFPLVLALRFPLFEFTFTPRLGGLW